MKVTDRTIKFIQQMKEGMKKYIFKESLQKGTTVIMAYDIKRVKRDQRPQIEFLNLISPIKWVCLYLNSL